MGREVLIVLEFRPYKRLDDDELLERTIEKINEVNELSDEFDEYIFKSKVGALNSLIKEIKLRRLQIDRTLIIKNIFMD